MFKLTVLCIFVLYLQTAFGQVGIDSSILKAINIDSTLLNRKPTRDTNFQKQYISRFSANIGEALPGIRLTDTSGSVIQMEEFKGNVLFINIWSTTCAPCLVSYPKQQKLMQEVTKMGLGDSILFVNICTGQSLDIDDWKAHVRKRADNAVNLYSDTTIFKQWGLPAGWPTYILLDKKGKSLGKRVPGPTEAGIHFILLAAVKGIAAKDAMDIRFRNEHFLYEGNKDIHPLYLDYLSNHYANYLPYMVWWTKQQKR